MIFCQYHCSLIKRTANKRILIMRKSAQIMLSSESQIDSFSLLHKLRYFLMVKIVLQAAINCCHEYECFSVNVFHLHKCF